MNIEWVIVKGISHFSDDSNTSDESWKSFASIMAASLVSNMLTDPVVFKGWPHYEGMSHPCSSDCMIIHSQEFSVQIFFCKLFQYYLSFKFFTALCFKLKSYINIKIPNNKGQKKNLFLGAFQICNTFLLYTDLTPKNQPETTTKPDKQIPGTILSMKLHYIQEHFQIRACLKHEMVK